MKGFPKVFNVGHRLTQKLFEGEVEATEKIDGSQLNFGLDKDSELNFRSKNVQIYPDNPPKMFKLGVDYVCNISNNLTAGKTCHAEFLSKPKHNTLCYDRVPKNNLMLFGVSQEDTFADYEMIEKEAKTLGIEVVPLLFRGRITSVDELLKLLECESVLGGCKIEGIVIKNYEQQILIGTDYFGITCGKVVSSAFREKNDRCWTEKKGEFEKFKESFRTEARWEKAIQHKRDSNLLDNSPRDIGGLIKEIQEDIISEEEDAIKERLYSIYKKDIVKNAVRGFPEFYKEKLIRGAF